MEVRRFRIDELVPGDSLRVKSLDYFISVAGPDGSLPVELGLPKVYGIDGRLYVNNGTQRIIFYALNGRDEVECRWRAPSDKDTIEAQLEVAADLRDASIFTFKDLVRKVKHPDRYRMR